MGLTVCRDLLEFVREYIYQLVGEMISADALGYEVAVLDVVVFKVVTEILDAVHSDVHYTGILIELCQALCDIRLVTQSQILLVGLPSSADNPSN